MEMNTRVQVRSNKELKDKAVALLDSMGLDLTTAVNMFLKQIVNEGGFPFQPQASELEIAVLAAMEEPAVEAESNAAFDKMLADA